MLDKGFQTLRLTKKNGGTDTISSTRDDWTPHPDGDDVEVMPLDIDDYFKWWSCGVENFITHNIIDAYRIGFGDEAFLVGRLVDHAGMQRNTPIIRFGNISLMADPSEKVRFKNRDQESFLVDCRSLSGMSGSAVFVTTTQTYRGEDAERVVQSERARLQEESEEPLPTSTATFKPVSVSGTYGAWLLGIDMGHIPMMKTVYEAHGETDSGLIVDANTGIACVLPAWCILDVLEEGKLVKERNRDEKKIAKEIEENKNQVSDCG